MRNTYRTDIERLRRMVSRHKLSGVVHMLAAICGENHPWLIKYYYSLIERDQ